MKLFNSILVTALAFNLSACLGESSSTDEECGPNTSCTLDGSYRFVDVEFKVISEGYQSDITGGQVIEARNQDILDDILIDIPSYSGEYPTVNFDDNQALAIFSDIIVCSHLEITSIKSNDVTTLVTVTEVVNTPPGLCDPSPGASGLYYAIIEYKRDGKPISIMYEYREDF